MSKPGVPLKMCPPTYEIIGPRQTLGMRLVALCWTGQPCALVCLEDELSPDGVLYAGIPVGDMAIARRMVGYRDEVVA